MKKKMTTILIIALCIVATSAATSVFINDIKNQEILEIKSEYELNIYNLDEQHNEQINHLTWKILQIYEYHTNNKSFDKETEKNKFIGTWSIRNNPSLFGFNNLTFYSNGTLRTDDFTFLFDLNVSWNITTKGRIILTDHYDGLSSFNYSYYYCFSSRYPDSNDTLILDLYPYYSLLHVDYSGIYYKR